MKVQSKIIFFVVGIIGLLALFFWAGRRPGLFANPTYLGALVAIEVVLACLWRFEKVFFPVTMICFLLAGTALPFSETSQTLRWVFLASGGLVGFIIWMKKPTQRFGLFHFVALVCVLSALVSAGVSDVPATAFLKVLSLFLLFLYASTGGRIAIAGHEESFVRGLVRSIEILVYAASACYFLAGYPVFGNPNSLGAIIGIVAVPVTLWAALVAQNRRERQRRYVTLALCAALLYLSVCRAAIVADAVVVIVVVLALRRPGLLLKSVFGAALLLQILALANPSHMGEFVDAMSGRFIFKAPDSRDSAFASRQGPWRETLSSIQQHPWFGTGFGTSSHELENGQEETEVSRTGSLR